jgi:asparagine synthase (glutamine-hydrolysing)
MHYENRYHITYNGELYNYLQLKEELIQLGHIFSNHTDTEVILAAFSQWGTLSFAKLKGMYAFALWDDQENDLFLVRDPAGIKPLYYFLDEQNLVFASEMRAFQSIGKMTGQNENWPVFLMAYGHIPEPVSTLKNVKPLSKGFFLKFNLIQKSLSLQSFNHYSYSCTLSDKGMAMNLMRNTFEQAVGRHMLADAPIGVFLSGGLDSSIITGLAAKTHKSALNTISMYFEEESYSEKKFQDQVVEQLGCKHFQLLLTEEEFHVSFPKILDSMDMPSCDGINTWFICKYAASMGLKAVLSGLGGDELFGGYPSFNRITMSEWIQHLPDIIKTSGKKSRSKKLTRMSYLKMEGIKGLYLFLRGHFTPYDIAVQMDAYESEIWKVINEMPVFNDITLIDDKNKASWMEFNLYMQNQLLRDADVMSMIHSVEIRVPFLDDQVIRMANQILPQVKYAGNRPKQFLIDTFSNIIPQGVWNRPKMGFSLPFEKWLKNSDHVKQLMIGGSSNDEMNYAKFMNGQLHWSHLMSLVILNHRNFN